MTQASSFDAAHGAGLERATVRRVRFATQANADDTVLMTFADPSPRKAFIASTRLNGTLTEASGTDRDVLDVLTAAMPPQDNPDLREQLSNWVAAPAAGAAPPIGTLFHGAQMFWRPGRAALLAAPERMELLLSALVDFAYYESELRKLEQEIAVSWPDVEADSKLAFEVTSADLEQHEAVGRRMVQALQRRMRYARIEPHLMKASVQLSLQGQELGARLREKCRAEERLEALDGQLDFTGHVYEMASQRIGEFRAGRQERKLEWIIIILLAVETLLLLATLIWNLEA